jgi:hypothetical protein
VTSWIFLKFSKHNRQVIEPSFCFVIFITKGAGPLGVIVICMDFSPSLFEGVVVGFGFVDEEVAVTWFNGFHFEELCKKMFSNRV